MKIGKIDSMSTFILLYIIKIDFSHYLLLIMNNIQYKEIYTCIKIDFEINFNLKF